MTLAELLEYTGKQFLDDRTDLVDGDADELWSDAYLVGQLNQAQRILCRRAWVIIETGVAPAGLITLATGKSLYQLHKSILRVYDATPTSQFSSLGRTDDVRLRNPYPVNADAFDIGEAASLAGNTLNTPGAPIAFATDSGSRTLRVSPEPAAAQSGVQVALKIARLPIKWLTLDNLEGCPEVPDEWHMNLCEYAAGKALTLPNVDAQMKTDGRLLLADFDAVVKEARRDRQRAENNGDRWTFASTTAAIQ